MAAHVCFGLLPHASMPDPVDILISCGSNLGVRSDSRKSWTIHPGDSISPFQLQLVTLLEKQNPCGG